MSRPTKPTALKVLSGTAQPCRVNPDEPKPEICIPAAPEYLKGAALSEWDRITPELERLGIISHLDLATVASYCLAYAKMVQAENEWKEGGGKLTIYSANGIEMVNPLVTIQNQLSERLRKLGNELGLTPASRSKVSGKPRGQGKDPWAEL